MQSLCQLFVLSHHVLDWQRVTPVIGQIAKLGRVFAPAVYSQFLRHTWCFIQLAQGDGTVDTVFGHVPVGRPLATTNCEETGVVYVDCVIARKLRRAAGTTGLDQRSDADKYTEHILALGLTAEVAAGLFRGINSIS